MNSRKKQPLLWKNTKLRLRRSLNNGLFYLYQITTRKVLVEMNDLLNYSKSFFKRNASTILTSIGGIGVVATSIMTAKVTPKALILLEEAKEEKGEELTKLEVVRVAGPSYIPAIILGVSTIACIFGANALNKRQQAALMSAYALLDNSYKEYKNKLVELYGEETHQNIVDSIAIEKAQDTYVHAGYFNTDCELALDEHCSEPVLFYDEYSNRYFEATIEQVITAEYHLNRNYVLRGSSVLNELYDFLGLEPTEYGEVLGWAPSDEGMYWIEFNHRKVVLDDGLECFIIEMPFEPSLDYDEY